MMRGCRFCAYGRALLYFTPLPFSLVRRQALVYNRGLMGQPVADFEEEPPEDRGQSEGWLAMLMTTMT